jgi:hypothetical protein
MNWSTIKAAAQPGDVLLLRHEPRADKPDCLAELIHTLDGPYDHAVLITGNDGQGNVSIVHAFTGSPAVQQASLGEIVPLANWVRAELRRHSPDDLSPNPNAAAIIGRADPALWRGAHYAYGDLLLAGLAASSARRSDVDERVAAILRTRILALCIIALGREMKEDTAAVTCASFIKSCHDGGNDLAGPFTSIDDRLAELEHGSAGSARVDDIVRDLLVLWADRHERRPLFDLMNETLCPDKVDRTENPPPPGVVTNLTIGFLRLVEQLHTTELVPVRPNGKTVVPDAARPIVTIEDVHRDPTFVRVWVEPPLSCECERPKSPKKGRHHI